MRLGTSAPLAHSGPADWAQKHRSLGLGAINFHLTCEDDPHLAEAFLREAEQQDLVMAEVGVWRNTLSPDPETRNASIRYAIGQLELADRIGARCCVNILGARGPRWDGAYRDNFSGETWLLAVKTIRQIIDAVNPRNTFFTIESMPWMVPTNIFVFWTRWNGTGSRCIWRFSTGCAPRSGTFTTRNLWTNALKSWVPMSAAAI